MSSNIDLKKICAFCGKEFIAHKTTTTCCSHRCSSLLYKQRKREAKVRKHDAVTEKVIAEKPIEKIKDKPFISITDANSIPCYQFKGKTLISRESLNALFDGSHHYQLRPAKEKQPITEFYTTKEVLEKFGISNSWLFKAAKENNFPKITQRGKILWSKSHIDRFFAKSARLKL